MLQSTSKHFDAKWVPEPNSGCWLWVGSVNQGGYGRLDSHTLAHRHAWETRFGNIPENMLVCHKCDVPSCVNPDHLFLGTHLDNAQDRDRKNRRIALSGENHGRTKLNCNDVKTIRFLIDSGAESTSTVSKRFNVHRKTVSDIASRKIWRSV